MSGLTPKQIAHMEGVVVRDHYLVPAAWWRMTTSMRRIVCNGIGPDKFPAWVRTLADWILEVFLDASGPHDVGYEYGTGTREDWHLRNDEFFTNCKKAIEAEYPALPQPGTSLWYRITHPLARLRYDKREAERCALHQTAQLLFLAVESDKGWDSYQAAVKRGPEIQLSPEGVA